MKTRPERITYAQQRLFKLIDAKKLTAWSREAGITPTIIFKIAYNEWVPTYRVLCKLVHLIAPAEWVFYTDEKLPETTQTLPIYDHNIPCKFIREHKDNYKEIAFQHDMTRHEAEDMFVKFRKRPTLKFIRECWPGTDPNDFFTTGDIIINRVPNRGEIINTGISLHLVLTKDNQSHCLTLSLSKIQTETSIKVEAEKSAYYAELTSLATIKYNSKISIVDNTKPECLSKIMADVKSLLE